MTQTIETVPMAQSSTVVAPHLPSIRAELERQLRFRQDQIGELAADAESGIAAGDEARRQVSRVLQVAAESALGEIEAALDRLQNGRYGSCERCAEPIPVERLETLPMSRFCTPCQYRLESTRRRTVR
jgi:RNA polymerase-binding transcription factor DksA